MRYRVVKRHNGLYVLDTETGCGEHISATLAGLLDHTKVEPLRPRLVLYDLVPLADSVQRGLECMRESYQRRFPPRKPRQADMPLTTKTLKRKRA